jgi:hypothetical protein
MGWPGRSDALRNGIGLAGIDALNVKKGTASGAVAKLKSQNLSFGTASSAVPFFTTSDGTIPEAT